METNTFEPEKDQSTKFECIGESREVNRNTDSNEEGDTDSQSIYKGRVLDDLTKISKIEGSENQSRHVTEKVNSSDSQGSQSSSEEEDEEVEDYNFAEASSEEEDDPDSQQGGSENVEQAEGDTSAQKMEKLKKSYQIVDEEIIFSILNKRVVAVENHFEYAQISNKFIVEFLKKFNFDVKRTCEAMVEPVMRLMAQQEEDNENLQESTKTEHKREDRDTKTLTEPQLSPLQIKQQILEGLAQVPLQCPKTLVKMEGKSVMEKTKEFLKSNPE